MTPIPFATCKNIAYKAGAKDPMRVASILHHATSRADMENSLEQLKRNEPSWFGKPR